MGAKYYYYPISSSTDNNTRSRTTKRSRDRGYEGVTTSRNLGARPETPPLSRSSSLSSSEPRTPNFRPISPDDHKTRHRSVAFASPVAEAFRRPLEDELFVMRRFASHAHHCRLCEDALKSYSPNRNLCDKGFGHAKDLGQYFYCSEGKPFSEIDKRLGRERVQIEVPGEYESVKHLFHALHNGLNLGGRPKTKRPEIHQSSKRHSPSCSPEPYRKTAATTPTWYGTTRFDNDSYEIRPSRTDSHRPREPVYYGREDRSYETRTPYDEIYTDIRQTPIITTARTMPASKGGKYYASRSKDDGQYGRRQEDHYLESRARDSKRHSHYRDGATRKRPTATYLMPYLSGLWN